MTVVRGLARQPDDRKSEQGQADRRHRLPRRPISFSRFLNNLRVGFEDQQELLEVVPFLFARDPL